MATKMDIHIQVQGSQIHNPGQTALKPGAGQSVVATGKPQDKTAVVHGQITNGPVFHNPA